MRQGSGQRRIGVGTLCRTLRHLKPIQMLARVGHRLHRPRPDFSPAPPLRAACGSWQPPAPREARLVGPSRVRVLGCERSLDEEGWDNPAVDRLWRYHLHYFEDLTSTGHAARRAWHDALVARWIAENPAPRGTGWEPYPVSMRIVNWIKWWCGGAAASPQALHSLAVQARWLRRRVEWHLLGNHLLANAKALVFAGLWFAGDEADAWLDHGSRLLARELPEQLLDDGGHFERSPLYHALVLEDLLDLINLLESRAGPSAPQRDLLPRLREHAASMLGWLRCMCHPDGRIALFNDAAEGIAPAPAQLHAYAARLGLSAPAAPAVGILALRPSGYVRVARGRMLALLDAAPIGPDYLPGHAHADTLSFELSLGRRRIIVNGGTSCYGSGPQRLRERGTAWHSTLQIGALDSSEVWSGFRVGRRARVRALDVAGWEVSAEHDGYRHLAGAPVHRRRWTFHGDGMRVEDTVAPCPHAAVARYHLAPGLALHADAPRSWRIFDGDAPLARVDVDAGHGEVLASAHAPSFGSVVATQALGVRAEGGRAITRWHWLPG